MSVTLKGKHMNIKFDSLESAPEEMREHLVEHKSGDNTQFVHKDYAVLLANAKQEAQGKHEALKKAKELEEQIAERDAQEKAKAEALEAEKKQMLAEKAEVLEKNKEFEKLIEVKAEQAASAYNDLDGKYQQMKSSSADLAEQNAALKAQITDAAKTELSSKLAPLFQDKHRAAADVLLKSQRISVTDDHKVVVLDQQGQELGEDIEQIKISLQNDAMFNSMLAGSGSTGGMAGGSGNRTGNPAITNKPFSQMTLQEKTEYMASKINQR